MGEEERNEPEGLWSVDEVATFLKLHPQTVYLKARTGELPSVKIGGSRRFRPAEVREWAESGGQPVEAAS